MKPVYLALTRTGLATARKAAADVPGSIHCLGRAAEGLDEPVDDTFHNAVDHLRHLYGLQHPIIGICATGILVRALGPVLGAKGAEPPVIAVSDDGRSVVPVLGGHGGANRLARQLAAALGAHAAITTAGDIRFGVSLDEPPEGWSLANREQVKDIMARLLDGEPVCIEGNADWLRAGSLTVSETADIRLVATQMRMAGGPNRLVYHPRCLALGIGCERGAEPAEVLELVGETLAQMELAEGAVALIATLDIKADETAILQAAAALDVPVRLLTSKRLEAETPRLANPSEAVFAAVGCHGVAEASALAAVGAAGRLLVEKRKSARATCAVALADGVIDAENVGRGRGELSIVGLGPGPDEWRSPEAAALIARSDSVVGYSYYLDLIEPLIRHKECHSYRLGAERERVTAALELAGQGRSVALVSSGDAGIYAMASLVFEVVDKGTISDAARRAAIQIAPGISALQAAAARAGAPLGHDFCAISLSDLLTPWPVIENRIEAAAVGDFVIAFYNPASQRRRTQLSAAREILLRHRPESTPVVVARQLGRAEESVRTIDLAGLDSADIDMMTLVIVGASTTRFATAGGRRFVYTPRGYDRKGEVKS